jgi:tetratricopeptide (TPR) repeat protein
MNPPERPSLEQARDAVGRGEWQQALDVLIDVDKSAPLSRPDLGLLAGVAYAAGRLDLTIGAWERAHTQSVHAGDHLLAAEAAVRVAMHLLFDTALLAPVRGWIKRAERLLEGLDETPVHAWLAVVHNYERLLSGDFERARRWARKAIEIGQRCDLAAAAIGRVAEARSLILAGEVSLGLELLNESAVAVVSGELDPLFTGIVYCELVCSLQGLAQYDLAEEWTLAMEQWRHGQPVGSIHGRCRVHRAEILRLRGSYLEAEQEALMACEELRPFLRREYGWPLTELGRIRLCKGDVEGAEEAFRAAHEVGWDPQPGLALVQLARGDVGLAAQSIRAALDHPLAVPSKELPPNTDLRRAPMLAARVEIEVAGGNLEAARDAADELSGIADVFESQALAASAALARARVALAEGDTVGARRIFEDAAERWNRIGAPYESAVARMGLACAYRNEGSEEWAGLEFEAARLGFERIGAMGKAAEAGRARDAVGNGDLGHREGLLRAAPATVVQHSDEFEFRREGDYWSLVFEGRTMRIRDLKGLRYLARLLADPGREFHVLDLVTGERGWSGDGRRSGEPGLAFSFGLDAGIMLDDQAKRAYRRRLAEIDDDIEEAGMLGDAERASQAEAERDFLIRELARAVGLGGRDRRVDSAAERARASVTRALRKAMARISEYDPALGTHLDRAIRTGTWCAYLPDTRAPVPWTL